MGDTDGRWEMLIRIQYRRPKKTIEKRAGVIHYSVTQRQTIDSFHLSHSAKRDLFSQKASFQSRNETKDGPTIHAAF